MLGWIAALAATSFTSRQIACSEAGGGVVPPHPVDARVAEPLRRERVLVIREGGEVLPDRLEVRDDRNPAFLLALVDVGGHPHPAGAPEVAALHAAQFPAAEAGADAEVDGAPLPGAGRRVEHGDRFVSGELVPGRLAALRPFRLPGRLDGRIRSTIQS